MLLDYLNQAAIQVTIVAVGGICSALLLAIAIRVTAAVVGTAVPRVGIPRLLLIGILLAIVTTIIHRAAGVILGDDSFFSLPAAGQLPKAVAASAPASFFLVAGLVLRLFPTTLPRACLVAGIYVLLTYVVPPGLVVALNVINRSLVS